MTERELKGLKDLPTPSPRIGAKQAALRAALDAYDRTAEETSGQLPQGFPSRTRRTHTTSNFPRRRMMKFSRSTYATAASIAVLAIAAPAAFVYLDHTDPRQVLADRQPVGSVLDMFSSGGNPDGRQGGEASMTSDMQPALSGANRRTSAVPLSPSTTTKDKIASKTGTGSRTVSRSRDSDLRFAGVSEEKAALPPPPPSQEIIGQGALAKMDDGLRREQPRSGAMALGAYNGDQDNQGSPVSGFTAAPQVANNQINGIISHNIPQDLIAQPPANRDRFDGAAPNPVKQVAIEPVSTFSVDVDTSSYSFIRRSLNAGQIPPKDAVRVEELINYFTYDYPRPETAAEPFKPTVTVLPSPWNQDRQLVHIGLKGYELANRERPRANLVFLIDVSGSMASNDKLPLLKQGLLMLLDKLRPNDTVGIVTYASGSGVALEPTKLSDKARIQSAIEQLGAGGSTAGAQGIQDAYRLVEQAFDKDAVNRVILGTDGDFNVGITDQGQLKNFIEEKRKTGIFLSVLGFGQGNYNDALMQALAQNGNGTAAYIDTLSEVRKVLIEEASSTLFPIAKDVKIQIEFNPAVVSEYRLVGYETRALRREDFNNDKIDAGDVGSGHAVTAIYEITLVGAEMKTVDGLRYQPNTNLGSVGQKKPAEPAPTPAPTRTKTDRPDELAFLKLRYKLPTEDASKLLTMPVLTSQALDGATSAPQDVRFAIAVATFGQLLRGDEWIGRYGRYDYDNIITLANAAKGDDPFGLRAQFVELVRLAKALSAKR
ncbi:MAG: hypothetical protein APF80_00435 [Alphaproteobacteria bacterium BRH_c36]|nr:MAG: hypothetical protein APF80_00435 [Alphaproteobacteria bacterium BRH_c36]